MKKWLLNNKKTLLLSLGIIGLGVLIFFYGEDELLTEDTRIKRESYDGYTKALNLDVTVGDMKFNDMEIEVSQKVYTEKQLDRMFEESMDFLLSLLFSGHPEGNVTTDIEFADAIPGTPIALEWTPQDESVISSEGKILVYEKTQTAITVKASYRDWSKEVMIEFVLEPSEEIRRRYIREAVENLLSDAEKMSQNDEYFDLPIEIGGKRVQYKESEDKSRRWIIPGAVLMALLVIAASVKDEKSRERKRIESITKEYPVVIMKLVMYLCAGMTVRNAWSRIVKKAMSEHKEINPIYREMELTDREINTGVSEAIAYERFGERIGEEHIVRFTALLSQNIKKGSTNLSKLLYEESGKAFEIKKQRAVKKGEEAGTLLLVPMIMLLAVVMLLIMVPAFMNM